MEKDHIESGALKVIHIVGISQESFEDAVQQGVRRAGANLKGIRGIEVEKYSAKVRDNNLSEFHAAMKIAFVVQD